MDNPVADELSRPRLITCPGRPLGRIGTDPLTAQRVATLRCVIAEAGTAAAISGAGASGWPRPVAFAVSCCRHVKENGKRSCAVATQRKRPGTAGGRKRTTKNPQSLVLCGFDAVLQIFSWCRGTYRIMP